MKKILTWLMVFICVNHLYAQTSSRGVDVAHTKDTSVFDGTTYAVIVGISGYKYIDPPLSFADRDALLFKDFLQSKAGGSVKLENIKAFIDQDANASTLPSIYRWLSEKKIKNGDRVYLYFAGHADAINSLLYYFLLWDCNSGGDKNNYLGMANVIRMYELKATIESILVSKGIQTILIWDACRTNELAGGNSSLQYVLNGIAEKTAGESLMLSTSADEISLENIKYAHGHGLFTYYLIDGLSGAADKPENRGNGDGKVDMKELNSYVTWEVANDAKKFKVNQDPRFIYDGNQGSEVLSIVDSSFQNEWALEKTNGNDMAINSPKTARGGNHEADSVVIELYNRFMESVKADSLDHGANSAEELYSRLIQKYPGNHLTNDAGFNLAMEYVNLAQDKINLYLSGQDELTVLATPKVTNEDHNSLTRVQRLALGNNYGKNGQYINRAIELLKKDSLTDVGYIKQLQAKADFLLARSYVSNEGIITDFSKAVKLAKDALSVQPKAAYNYQLFGSLFYINKQYDSSVFYLRKAVSLAPNWVNALTNLGLAFAAVKKTDSARYYYHKAIAINPDFLVPYANLSYSFSSQNSFDSAYKYGRKAVDLNPLYTDGVDNLGIIFHFQKIYDSAKSYYHKAISIDPGYSNAYYNLGILFYNEKKYDSAESYFRKVISLDPKYSNAYFNLGMVFESKKQFDSAKAYYYKTINIDPGYADAYNGLGNIFQDQLKLPDSAKVYYHKAISIDPKATYAFYNLGILFNSQSEYDSARYYYKRALDIDPKYTYAYNNLGLLFYNQKQYDSAAMYYRKSLQIDPKYTDAYNNLGLLFYNQKQYDSAAMYYRKTLQIDPKYTNAYYNLGLLFYDQNQYDSAKYYFYNSITIDPEFTNGYNGLGNIFKFQRHYDSAKHYFLKAISIDPKFTNGYNNLGNTFMSANQFDSARLYYYYAINTDPKFTLAYYNLGLLFDNQKQYDSAAMYFRKILQIDPDNTNAFNNLGLLFDNQKQYDSAAIYFRKILQIDPKYTDAFNNLGLLFINQKQYDSAAVYFHKTLQIDPKYTNAFNNLGLLFYNQKQYDSAAVYFHKTLQIDPKYTNAFINLGLLFINQKQYDSAIWNYHAVLALDSLNLNAYSYLSVSMFLKNEMDSSVYFLKKILTYRIADSSTFKIGRILSDHFQRNKLFAKEIEVTQPLYDYDSVHNVPGVTREQFRSLADNLAFAYLFNRQPDVSKYYYEKEGTIVYFYYNMACMESLDKKNKEALENLELSFQNGYADYEHIQQDTDLDNIRNTDEFKQLLKKYFPGNAK